MVRLILCGVVVTVCLGVRGAVIGQEEGRRADEAASRGPALQGRIVDEAGRPLAGAKVILYGGLATRWEVARAESDADGRYRFDALQTNHVGVRIEHPTHVEADGRSWRDVHIPPDGTLDLKLVPAGRIEGTLKDAKTGEPLRKLELRIMTPVGSHGHGSTFHVYATTDEKGWFRSLGLFPGEYDVEVNSSTLDYPVVGRARVAPGATTVVDFAVSLPRVVGGRVLGADDRPLDGVELTLLASKDSDVEPRHKADFGKVRSRAWTIYRPRWQERFELAFLPGLEDARFVLAAHKERGWAKVSVATLEKGEPIRLRPWEP